MLLRRLFGPKKWREAGEHCIMTRFITSKIHHMFWGRVARMGETRNAYKISIGKPEGKRPVGRPKYR
jgi:hypothetical protein